MTERPSQYQTLLVALLLFGCAPASDQAGTSGGATDFGELAVWAEDSTVADVRDVVAAADGDVWVLATQEPFLRRYDRDGAPIVTFGRSGGGPGELRNPWSLLPPADPVTGVAVWDIGSRGIQTYDGAGTMVNRENVPSFGGGMIVNGIGAIAIGHPGKLRRFSGGRLLAQFEPRGLTSGRDFASIVVLALGPDLSVTDTIVDFRVGADTAVQPRSARELVPIPFWDTCGDTTMVVLDPYRRRITWYGADLAPVGEDSLSLMPRPLRSDDIRRYLRHRIAVESRAANQTVSDADQQRMIDRMVERGREMFSVVAPPVVDMLCSDDGELWVQEFVEDGDGLGRGTRWMTYRRDGVWERVNLPKGFQPRVISAQSLLGVYRDELDVAHIAVLQRTQREW